MAVPALPPGFPPTYFYNDPRYAPDSIIMKYRRLFVLSVCDSMHDFLKPGKQARCTPQPKSQFRDELKQTLARGNVREDLGITSDAERDLVFSALSSDIIIEHSEHAAGELSFSEIPTVFPVTAGSPAARLKLLESIFAHFGFTSMTDDNNPIKIVRDGSVGKLGTLTAQVLKEKLIPKLSIVHVVTPATVCDSAGMSIKDFAGNPILFETPFNVGIDAQIHVDEISKDAVCASTFSGLAIIPRSDYFDSNGKSPARIKFQQGDLHTYLDMNLPVGKFGPSVDNLCAGINHNTQTFYDLHRFSNAQKFDTKRCGDSHQVRFCKKLSEINYMPDKGGTNGYVFVTGDEICAYIASLYGLATIYQSSTAFRLFKGIPRQAGGEKMELSIPRPIPENMNKYGGDEDDDLPDEAMLVSSICAAATSAILSAISKAEFFIPLAAACSAYNCLTVQSGKLKELYIQQHNNIYTPYGYAIHSGLKYEDVTLKLYPLVAGLTKNYPLTIRPALQIIGTEAYTSKVAGMYLI